MPILMLIRGALVIAVALLAVRVLRHSPAHLRYLVLASALGAVLVLPVLSSLVPAWHTGVVGSELPEVVVAPDLPIAEPSWSGRIDAPQLALVDDRAPLPWAAIAAGVWLAGVGLVLLRVLVGATRARLIARRGTTAERPERAETWRSLDGRGEPPRLVVSDQIESPIVVGSISPVVVVPRLSSTWSSERWRVVLLHELAHVRQRDGIANLIGQLACALHWVNPLAWIAMRRLREQRELAADDAVLRAGARASSYAEHLLAIATSSSLPAPSAALAMVERSSRFEARVVALLDGDRARATAGARRALIAIGAMAAVAAGTACVSPDDAPASASHEVVLVPGAPARSDGIDRTLQRFAELELDRAIAANNATGAVAIVLDAKTGNPVIVASRGELDPRTAVTPGSVIKPFTFAAALEAGTVQATTKIDCENGSKSYGARTLKDESPHGQLDLGGILAVSSNVGAAKVAEPLGDLLGESLRRYHLPAPAHVDTRSLEGVAIAWGGFPVSPLEVAAAYTALADDGIYHAGGTNLRVMREETARTIRGLLERVVTDADGTGHAARIANVRIAGKTGTAKSRSHDYYASFVGIVPADAPKYVVLVGIDGVTGSGGKVAAPVFATIAAKALGR